MSDDRARLNNRLTAGCWVLAGLSGAFAVFCWVADPFYEGGMAAQGLGSLFSMLAAFASVGTGLVLGAVGLILARRFLLLLALLNLGVSVTAAWCLYADGLYPGSTKTHSGFALLAASVLISVAMFALRRAGAPGRTLEGGRPRDG